MFRLLLSTCQHQTLYLCLRHISCFFWQWTSTSHNKSKANTGFNLSCIVSSFHHFSYLLTCHLTMKKIAACNSLHPIAFMSSLCCQARREARRITQRRTEARKGAQRRKEVKARRGAQRRAESHRGARRAKARKGAQRRAGVRRGVQRPAEAWYTLISWFADCDYKMLMPDDQLYHWLQYVAATASTCQHQTL